MEGSGSNHLDITRPNQNKISSVNFSTSDTFLQEQGSEKSRSLRGGGPSFSFYQKNTMIRKQVLISISGERGRPHDEGPSLLCRFASQWNSCVSLQLPSNKGQAAWRLRSDWLTFRSLWPMAQLLCEEANMGGAKHNRV